MTDEQDHGEGFDKTRERVKAWEGGSEDWKSDLAPGHPLRAQEPTEQKIEPWPWGVIDGKVDRLSESMKILRDLQGKVNDLASELSDLRDDMDGAINVQEERTDELSDRILDLSGKHGAHIAWHKSEANLQRQDVSTLENHAKRLDDIDRVLPGWIARLDCVEKRAEKNMYRIGRIDPKMDERPRNEMHPLSLIHERVKTAVDRIERLEEQTKRSGGAAPDQWISCGECEHIAHCTEESLARPPHNRHSCSFFAPGQGAPASMVDNECTAYWQDIARYIDMEGRSLTDVYRRIKGWLENGGRLSEYPDEPVVISVPNGIRYEVQSGGAPASVVGKCRDCKWYTEEEECSCGDGPRNWAMPPEGFCSDFEPGGES